MRGFVLLHALNAISTRWYLWKHIIVKLRPTLGRGLGVGWRLFQFLKQLPAG